MDCDTRHRRLAVVVRLAAAVLLLGSCGGAQSAVAVEITAPPEGAEVVAGQPVALAVRLDGAELVADDHPSGSDGHDARAGDEAMRGHLHIFVDGQLVAMPSELEPEVTLPPGSHTVTVEFVDEDHLPLKPRVTDEIRLEAGR